MRILHTVEFYHPSVGGAQEVVKQVSERLVRLGHDVTVATTALPERRDLVVNGVKIEPFAISGNAARGVEGEAARYQEFLRCGRFDVMMNYAAQTWTSDLAFDVLHEVPYAKVLAPCGFSGLHVPLYARYFRRLPEVLRRYDRLIFHSEEYQDAAFAREHGISSARTIPNACGEDEFGVVDATFRERHGIPDHVPMLLTVGSHTSLKGHRETLHAFRRARTGRAVLIVVGNFCQAPPLPSGAGLRGRLRSAFLRVREAWRYVKRGLASPGCVTSCRRMARLCERMSRGRKRVLLLDPPRADVVAAYHAADLFVFPSNVECSPLVLFEAMATRTPFLASDVGNSAEIVRWGGGGRIVRTRSSGGGFRQASIGALRVAIEELLSDPGERERLGESGHAAWRERFTWEKVVLEYERVYEDVIRARGHRSA